MNTNTPEEYINKIPIIAIDGARVHAIIDTLDKDTRLHDGGLVIALYTMEQAIRLLPRTDDATEHLVSSTYTAFAHILSTIYVSPLVLEDYMHDASVLAAIVKSSIYQ